MQRTILVAGGGDNNTYTGTGSTVTYYSPLGGCDGPIGGLQTSTQGTGAYGRSNAACVLSNLYIAVGKVYSAAVSVTAQVNVQGTSPQAGHLQAGNPAALNSNPAYYYDATDIDAITAGQQIGFMETLSASTGSAIVSSRGVICDCVSQALSTPYMFFRPQAYPPSTSSPRYTGACGSTSLTATVATSQQYASLAFVASGLQWQTGAGNTDTVGTLTCTFGYNASWGSSTDSSMSVKVHSAGFVGQMYEATDIAAVPAGDYYGLHWNGRTSSSTFKLANAGIHLHAASNNTCAMMSWSANGAGWTARNPTYALFNQHSRFDYAYTETITVVPNSGVFSRLAVNIAANTYTSPTTFIVQNGPTSGDTGAGEGDSPSAPSELNNTSVVAAAPAQNTGWFYDATDIAAFLGGTNQLLLQANGAVGGVNLQALTISFTAAAH